MALFLCLFALQEPDLADRVRSAIELLESDRIDERERAQERLCQIGELSVPSLRQARRTAEPETRRRIQAVLGWIEVRAALPGDLRNDHTAIERLLKADSSYETAIFLEILRKRGNLIPTGYGRHFYYPKKEFSYYADLDRLSARALRGARTSQEKYLIIRACSLWRLESSASELRGMLPGLSEELQWEAKKALFYFQRRKVVETICDISNHPHRDCQKAGRYLLVEYTSRHTVDLVPALKKVLTNSNPELRCEIIRMLGIVGRQEDSPVLRQLLLTSPSSCCRRKAAWALVSLDYAE